MLWRLRHAHGRARAYGAEGEGRYRGGTAPEVIVCAPPFGTKPIEAWGFNYNAGGHVVNTFEINSTIVVDAGSQLSGQGHVALLTMRRTVSFKFPTFTGCGKIAYLGGGLLEG